MLYLTASDLFVSKQPCLKLGYTKFQQNMSIFSFQDSKEN